MEKVSASSSRRAPELMAALRIRCGMSDLVMEPHLSCTRMRRIILEVCTIIYPTSSCEDMPANYIHMLVPVRRVVTHAFSDRALMAQEPLIQGYVDQLVNKLKGVTTSTNNKAVDMVQWYKWYVVLPIADTCVPQIDKDQDNV